MSDLADKACDLLFPFMDSTRNCPIEAIPSYEIHEDFLTINIAMLKDDTRFLVCRYDLRPGGLDGLDKFLNALEIFIKN